MSSTAQVISGINLAEFQPDYCIVVKKSGDKSQDLANVKILVTTLRDHGLYSQVRPGSGEDILVLTKCSVATLNKRAKDEAINDWLCEIPVAVSGNEENEDESDEKGVSHISELVSPQADLSPAQQLRLIYGAIVRSDIGAGINCQAENWKFVESILPLHDQNINSQWVKAMSTQWMVGDSELNIIRKHFGEKVAMYFGFLQYYFICSLGMAAIGVGSHYFLGPFSSLFAVFNIIWAITFVYLWKRRQNQLAIRWGVKETSNLKARRHQFKPQFEAPDPITGEVKPIYPEWKRYMKRISFIPVALFFALVLMSFQVTAFILEIFITQIYDGSGKLYLSFIPIIFLAVMSTVITKVYLIFVEKLTNWENHETDEQFEHSYTQKQFVLQFLVSFMPMFLTSYIYLPFAHRIVPHLDFIRNSLSPRKIAITNNFEINSRRLHQQVVYFSVTAQIVSLVVETVLPYIIRLVLSKVKGMKSKDVIIQDDDPREAKFLDYVRSQVALPEYNIHEDYRQLIVQFGGILFSPAWPLAAFAASVINWIQLRGDAVKICVDTRRPIPKRAENIGPWMNILTFLTWLSSITTSSIIAMFSPITSEGASIESHISLVSISPWILFGVILLSEHLFFVVSYTIRVIVDSVPTKEVFLSRKKRYLSRKSVLATETQLASTSISIDREMSEAEDVWKQASIDDLINQAEKAVSQRTLKEKKDL